MAFLSSTAFEALGEPAQWHVNSDAKANWSTYSQSLFPLQIVSNKTFSQFGNTVQVGYFISPFWANSSLNLSLSHALGGIGITPLPVMVSVLWLQELKLGLPYTGISLRVDSYGIDVNGLFMSNVCVPYCYSYDIVPYTDHRSVFDSNRSEYFIFCTIDNPLGKPLYYFVNPGNYTFSFDVEFTPIFEIGPYWFDGTPQQISYHYNVSIYT